MQENSNKDPIQAIKADMDTHNWTYNDVAALTGFVKSSVNEYLNYRRRMPMRFIRAYHALPDTTVPLDVLIQAYDLKVAS